MKHLRAMPYTVCGMLMIMLSRESAIRYGIIITGASLIYMWLASRFSKETEVE